MSRPGYRRCVVTDRPIEYVGYGRPPKYASERIKREADLERRKARRSVARQERKQGPLSSAE